MWIICYADDSHEMPSFILSEKYKKKIKLSFAAVVISTIRIKTILSMKHNKILS